MYSTILLPTKVSMIKDFLFSVFYTCVHTASEREREREKERERDYLIGLFICAHNSFSLSCTLLFAKKKI